MNAKLIVRKNAQTTSITIKRSMSFKIIHCATADTDHTIKHLIIDLSNQGYNVTVQE